MFPILEDGLVQHLLQLWAHQPSSLQPLYLGDSGPNPLILFLSHLRTVNWAMATEAHPASVFSFLLPISLCLVDFRVLTFQVELPSQSGRSNSSCLSTLKLILGVTGCLCSQEDTLTWWVLLVNGGHFWSLISGLLFSLFGCLLSHLQILSCVFCFKSRVNVKTLWTSGLGGLTVCILNLSAFWTLAFSEWYGVGGVLHRGHPATQEQEMGIALGNVSLTRLSGLGVH